MDHGLVGPLVEERGHGVISSVKEDEDGGNVRGERKEVVLTLDRTIQLLGQPL